MGRLANLCACVAAALSLAAGAWGADPAGAGGRADAAKGVIYTKDNAPSAPKLEDLPLKQSVSRDGITWTFEKPVRAGQFVNGDWYAVGSVTVVAIDPKPLYGEEVKDPGAKEKATFKGKYCRNGSVLNVPVVGFQSGFDSRVPHRRYKPELSAHLPISMKPGDTLVSSISREKPASSGYCIGSYSALTCLAEPVPLDAFRPGYCDRQQVIYLARNLRRELLPRLALPPAPKPEETAGLRIKTYPPTLKNSVDAFARLWNELNFFEGDQATYQSGGYGRAVAERFGRASLLLMLDFEPEQKEPLLINLTQYGLDLWSLVKNGFRGWVAHGGWGSGRKWAIVLAGIMLGDERMANVNKSFPEAMFQEDQQTQYDDCFSGAGVVYYGHVGTRVLTEPKTPAGWGTYEHLHPSRWVSWIGTSYRTNMTSSTWVAEALAIRIMQAEKQWNHDAFLDYCDRWMTEPDTGYGNPYAFSKQGGVWDPFFKQMWTAYRGHLPAVGGKEGPPRPPTGWKKQRKLEGPEVQIGRHRELRVNGKPFFPLMMFAVMPERIDDALAIGVNVLAEGSFEPHVRPHFCVNNREFLDKLAAKGLYGVFGADARTIGHPALLGWIHIDGPDKALLYPPEQRRKSSFVIPSYRCVAWAQENDPLQKGRDEVLVLLEPAFRWMRATDKGRPVFLTLSSNLLSGQGAIDPNVKDKLYREFAKSCDVLGSAVCPMSEWNAPSRLGAVAEGVTQLAALAGPDKPLYAWIETRADSPPKGDANGAAAASVLTPTHVRTEVWMAIVRGATGIGYRGFESAKADEKPDKAMMAELKRLNARIASLAPAILAAPAKAKVAMTLVGEEVGGHSPPYNCHLKATQHGRSLYIFAQTIDLGVGRDKRPAGRAVQPRGGPATFTVDGLKAGTKIEVVGEERTVTAGDGRFTDAFGPLTEHVYRLPAP